MLTTCPSTWMNKTSKVMKSHKRYKVKFHRLTRVKISGTERIFTV